MKKNSNYGMPPPATRSDFEHNVYLVLERVLRAIETEDEEHIRNQTWSLAPHLKRVKYLPNRRIDLSTVNEMLRSQANMFDWMEQIDVKNFPPGKDD